MTCLIYNSYHKHLGEIASDLYCTQNMILELNNHAVTWKTMRSSHFKFIAHSSGVTHYLTFDLDLISAVLLKPAVFTF